MIFKRSGNVSDDYFTGKRIGVIGLGPRDGTTHIAVAISNYLSEIRHKRVCLAEHNRHGDLSELTGMLGADPKDEVFTFHRVTYVRAFCDRDNMPDIRYDCMVFDFGHEYDRGMNILKLCDLKIAVASDAPWRRNEYAVIRELAEKTGNLSDWRLFVNLGNTKYLREKDIFGMTTGCFPFEPDPVFPCRETNKFLEEIL